MYDGEKEIPVKKLNQSSDAAFFSLAIKYQAS